MTITPKTDGPRTSKVLLAALALTLCVAALIVLLITVGGAGPTMPWSGGGERVAYEVTWREQSTQQRYVSGDMSGCQTSELACRDAALSGGWVTVPGGMRTKRDYVCAADVEEALRLAGEGVRVTGKTWPSADCSDVDSLDGQE